VSILRFREGRAEDRLGDSISPRNGSVDPHDDDPIERHFENSSETNIIQIARKEHPNKVILPLKHVYWRNRGPLKYSPNSPENAILYPEIATISTVPSQMI
jgi:hypothetical protein